jgi:hypothetical protein
MNIYDIEETNGSFQITMWTSGVAPISLGVLSSLRLAVGIGFEGLIQSRDVDHQTKGQNAEKLE